MNEAQRLDPTGCSRAYRELTIDRSVANCGTEKAQRIDLGLALLAVYAKPGAVLSTQDIALWCGCTRDAIRLVELRALMKLRHRLKFGRYCGMGKEIAA